MNKVLYREAKNQNAHTAEPWFVTLEPEPFLPPCCYYPSML